jgi:cytochrome c551/c552
MTRAHKRLVVHVTHGSSGTWGDDAMSSNRRVSDEHIDLLVTWILRLDAGVDP